MRELPSLPLILSLSHSPPTPLRSFFFPFLSLSLNVPLLFYTNPFPFHLPATFFCCPRPTHPTFFPFPTTRSRSRIVFPVCFHLVPFPLLCFVPFNSDRPFAKCAKRNLVGKRVKGKKKEKEKKGERRRKKGAGRQGRLPTPGTSNEMAW